MLDNLVVLAFFIITPAVIYMGVIHLQFRKMRTLSRIPIKEIPRPPGWSLQKRVEELTDQISTYSLVLIGGNAVGGIMYLSGDGLVAGLVVSFLCTILSIYKLYRLMPSYANYKLGLTGEQAVGAILNTLSHETVQVYHDYQIKEPGSKPWNIDHIAVSPEGVFLIETKTRRKLKGKSNRGQDGYRVNYDGKLLNFPFGSDYHGLKQAKRSAEWLSKKLSSSVGEHISVKPLLALPGWMVQRKGKGEVDVLNEKELLSYFRHPKPVITPTLQKRITHQLERHCIVDLSK